MTVDVTWDGVALAKSATVREQDGGWFVELEQPMPVGTSVVLTGDVQATAQVARVHEGLGAGMLLKAASRSPAPVADAAAGNSGPTPESDGPTTDKKEKRKKRR